MAAAVTKQEAARVAPHPLTFWQNLAAGASAGAAELLVMYPLVRAVFVTVASCRGVHAPT